MRYLPLTAPERRAMLDTIGVGAIDDLFCDVPESARRAEFPDLPPHQGEMEVERAMARLAARNVPAGSVPFFCGAGAYRHHVPATVDHLVQRSEFLTSYTPYQPEISQGTLQYLFEFQSQVALLTGMEVANASLYDGSTACAERVLMAHRVTKRARTELSGGLHPHYRAVVRTMTAFSGEHVVEAPVDPLGGEDLAGLIDGDTACVVVQYPDVFGRIRDMRPLAEAAHARGALLVAVFNEPVAFGALNPPGAMGADIVAGEGQGLGNALNFGGPYLGLFATREKFLRQMPGRLCGETVDAEGRRGFVLTLSAREQHIRREKATSNICTNSGLCALGFTIHMALLGEIGLRRLARLNHAAAARLADLLAAVPGVEVLNDAFFNEFTIRTPRAGTEVIDALAERDILGGVPAARLYPGDPALADLILVASTETNTEADRVAYADALRAVLA
jgi:glycine dehydrogenase subunit 1